MASDGSRGGDRPFGVVAPRSLLTAVIPAAVGLAVVHLAIYVAFGSVANAVGAALVIAFVALLAAGWIAVRRRRPRLAIAFAGGGLIVIGAAMAALVPTTGGLALMAPILLMTLAMTYVSRARLGGLAIAAWCAGVAILVLIQLVPDIGATAAPPAVMAVLRVVQPALGLGFVLVLLWQFSTHLDLAIDKMAVASHAAGDAQDTIKRVNRELRKQVQELEMRNREATLVSHMGSLLEVSQTVAEAYGVIERAARMLFPGLSGSLFVVPPSRLVVERVARWGDTADERMIFQPDDCWALRQGRLYILDKSQSGPVCGHMSASEPTPYMCIPMTAQGTTLGVFHLAASPVDGDPEAAAARAGRSGEGRAVEGRLDDGARNLGLWVAELLALSLANFRLRETLRVQSTRDPLTGLYNRRFMEDSLERELYRSAREKRPLGVVMADLDHFKAFNDEAGHVAGDAVLRWLAEALTTNVRAEDIVCRYGGEEFTILLPNANLEETRQRAETLREVIRARSGADGRTISMSLGVAAYPTHGDTADALIQAADAALYAAKAAGRDQVVVAAS